MSYTSGDTIFYTSDLSLNTAYSTSANAVSFNASLSANSVAIKVSDSVFNVSANINSMNSELYIANVSTNAVILSNYLAYKPYGTETSAETDTDTQVWIG